MQKILIPLVFGFGGVVQAEEPEPLITERPGFSSSPFTLAPSAVQIEAGYLLVNDDRGQGFDAQYLPLALLRYGLAEDIELQFGWGGYAWTEVGSTRVNGAIDASIGVKWQITDDAATLPVGLFAGVSVPVGADALSSDSADPRIGAFWSHSAGLDLFGTVLVSDQDNGAQVSNALGISLPIDEKLGSFVEYYGVYGDGGPEHYLNGGFTYLSRFNLQWDSYLGLGLNDRSIDIAFNVGMSWRMPQD